MGTAVICIDMQNDFCLPDAPLFVKESPACIPRCKQLIARARELNIPVIWVIREHDRDGVDVEHTRQHLYKDGQGPTVAGTPGAQIVADLQPLESEAVIIKKRFSAFFNTPLDGVLRRKGIKNLILCGVQTPNCIRSCAFDGICLDYSVTVSTDATASASQAVQDANLHGASPDSADSSLLAVPALPEETCCADMSNVGVTIATTQQIMDSLA